LAANPPGSGTDPPAPGDTPSKKSKWPLCAEHTAALVIAVFAWAFWLWYADQLGPPTPLARQQDPGIAQYLLSDPLVLAAVHIGIIALCLFAAVSFGVHAFNKNWMEGFGKDGFQVRRLKEEAGEGIEQLRTENERLVAQGKRQVELLDRARDEGTKLAKELEKAQRRITELEAARKAPPPAS
jgi:hypothetical protein